MLLPSVLRGRCAKLYTTGDTHSSWVHEIERGSVLAGSTDVRSTLAQPLDVSPGNKRGRIVEFGGSAVSSNGWGATWRNSANATERAASQLVQNSGSLLYSEGFCESASGAPDSRSFDLCGASCFFPDRGYLNVEVSYDNVTVKFHAYEDNQITRTQNRTEIASFVVPDGDNMVQR